MMEKKIHFQQLNFQCHARTTNGFDNKIKYLKSYIIKQLLGRQDGNVFTGMVESTKVL